MTLFVVPAIYYLFARERHLLVEPAPAEAGRPENPAPPASPAAQAGPANISPVNPH